jgi:hypothetical protein
MLKNVPNLYRAAKHVDRSQTLAGQSLEPILALKNVEVPLGRIHEFSLTRKLAQEL